jgi:hypothetical protein
VECADFRVTILGGAWLMEEKGKAFDAFPGAARKGGVEDWCIQYGLTRSARFNVDLYGEHHAHIFREGMVLQASVFLRHLC